MTMTKFYTAKWDDDIATVEGLISLNIGDTFLGNKGEHYKVVWKIYNPFLKLMIYHGEIVKQKICLKCGGQRVIYDEFGLKSNCSC